MTAKTLSLAFDLMFLAFALAFTLLAARDFFRAHASHSWPAAVGRITASGASERWPGRFDSGVRFEYSARGALYTGRHVTYRQAFTDCPVEVSAERQPELGEIFRVCTGGRPWELFRFVHFMTYMMGRDAATEEALRYPEGMEVKVYYHPERPEQAILEPGASFTFSLLPGLGLLVCGNLLYSLTRAWLLPLLRPWLPEGLPPLGLILLTLATAALLWLAVDQAVKSVHLAGWSKASPRWPIANGKVLAAHAEPSYKLNWRPRIYYRYHVGGHEYTSTLLSFDVDVGNQEWAEQTAADFPAGARVPVYYHPGRPEVAVLKPGAAKRGSNLALLAGIFAVCGLLGSAWWWLHYLAEVRPEWVRSLVEWLVRRIDR